MRIILSHAQFRYYWLIAALIFSSYFALISVSPIIFMGDMKLSEYQYVIVLLIYGVAYLLGGVLASALQKRLSTRTQIDIGLILLGCSGLILLLFISTKTLSPTTLVIPMLISAVAVTITRPAAISAAMLLFSKNAGTAASTGKTLMFLTAAATSAALAQAGAYLSLSIAVGFVSISLVGLLISARASR